MAETTVEEEEEHSIMQCVCAACYSKDEESTCDSEEGILTYDSEEDKSTCETKGDEAEYKTEKDGSACKTRGADSKCEIDLRAALHMEKLNLLWRKQ